MFGYSKYEIFHVLPWLSITQWTLPAWAVQRQNQRESVMMWTASSEFGTYRLCEQRRFRRACASAQSRQNLRCSLIQAVSQEEPSDRKPDPWPLWMAGHAQLKFVMTECSKTQIRLAGLMWSTSLHLSSKQWLELPHDNTNKITCADSEDSDQPGHQPSLISLRCPHEETLGPQLPIEHTVKTLIRLGRCPGWSESLLGAYVILLVLLCCSSFITQLIHCWVCWSIF